MITVRMIAQGEWEAHITDDPDAWAVGHSKSEAIGNLISNYAEMLGLTITDEQ